jgi:hypothetical protein
MKKRLSISLFLFIVSAICLPLFSFAQQDTSDMSGNEMVMQSPSPQMTITPTPDYYMAYPGLLPDSPLYIFKTMRDRMISLLIGDPIKKSEFDILQTDKRVGAAVMLIDYGGKNEQKQELAVSTISKGFNYFDEAIQKAFEAKKQGDSTMELKAHLKKAGAMYDYLLEKEKTKTTKVVSEGIRVEKTRLDKLLLQVNGL